VCVCVCVYVCSIFPIFEALLHKILFAGLGAANLRGRIDFQVVSYYETWSFISKEDCELQVSENNF
jgi:hypothetical protein